MRRAGALLFVGLAAAQPSAQDSGSDLSALVQVERALLEDARQRYEALSRKRDDLTSQIAQLRAALDGAVAEREAPDPRRVSEIAGQWERAESDRASLQLAERLLVERIALHLERIELLQHQLENRPARATEVEGVLTGNWELVLMPSGLRGTAALQQTGVLVGGTYQLDGGWSGSLQGTLVNRKVFLVRIDSKLGKSMEFEGFLSNDGKRIRGTWLDYELAGGDGATGQWTAQRQGAPR